MSTGELLVAQVAMKPLATLNRPVLKTVDVDTKEETVSFKERTDVTAVPAMGVVAETMTALVLANEAIRKFGGDSIDEFLRNHADGVSVAGERREHVVLVGMMGAGKSTVGAGSPSGSGGRSSTATAGRGGDWPHRARDLRARRRGGVPRHEDRALAEALDAPGAVGHRRGRGECARLRRTVAACRRRRSTSSGCGPTRPRSLFGRSKAMHRPLLDDDPAGVLARHGGERASRCIERWPTPSSTSTT